MKLKIPQLHKILNISGQDSLYKILRQNDIPVASSCLGDGVCGKCRLTMSEGAKHLLPPNAVEQKLIDKYQLQPTERISCQIIPSSDLTVTSKYW